MCMHLALLLVVALVWFGLVGWFVYLSVCLAVSVLVSVSVFVAVSVSVSVSLSCRCSKNTLAAPKKHRFAQKTPFGCRKNTLGAGKTPFWSCENTTAEVLKKHRGCGENTLIKNTSSVLRKHSLTDTEKTPPGAEKTFGPQNTAF